MLMGYGGREGRCEGVGVKDSDQSKGRQRDTKR